MKHRFTVDVDINDQDPELKDWQEGQSVPVSVREVVRSEIQSNLESLGYITGCNVAPLTLSDRVLPLDGQPPRGCR